MIRAATFSDIPRLVELVRQGHARSIHKDIPLLDKAVRSYIMDGIRRHGGKVDGATLFNVVEFRGQIEGMMLCVLQKLYLICDKLEAQDFWLYASNKCPAIGPSKLIDEYVRWCEGNKDVGEVKLSYTDVLGVDDKKLCRLFQRKGFAVMGGIYRRAP